MPPRRAVKGRLARRNVEEQELPNALEVQPQGEITIAEFREAIRMLSQVGNNQAGQQKGAQQEEAETSRIHEFLRMNLPSFNSSSTLEDPENFIQELKKVFDMHVTDTVRVELATYYMKNVARTWFEQWKGDRAEDVEKEKLRDREEFKNNRAKTGNKSGQLKSNANRSSLQQKQKGLGLSSANCPKNKQGNGNGGNKSQSLSVAPPDWASPSGATFGTGGGT
ncbi:uncharacterized protein LOC125850908 [Solanum stenotomum]|uniref:uncharacterized protein LOC125850908 n=1 Tax=Solanum stenotomum TaxID=172797 RepID=UPI0020D03860|nr:uncharacterized protein LOC125850908 [Solanum stenotomum]